jgi:hypothetical protein
MAESGEEVKEESLGFALLVSLKGGSKRGEIGEGFFLRSHEVRRGLFTRAAWQRGSKATRMFAVERGRGGDWWIDGLLD